ncbi:hypothetical protein P3S67_013498 [Capsicum chacoense]
MLHKVEHTNSPESSSNSTNIPKPSKPDFRSNPLTPQTYQNPSKLDFRSKPNDEIRLKSRDHFTPIGYIEDCRDFKREIEKMIQDISIMVQNIDSVGSSSHADMQTNG